MRHFVYQACILLGITSHVAWAHVGVEHQLQTSSEGLRRAVQETALPCPTPPWPFGYTEDKAEDPDFIVTCLPSGELLLPSINVVISTFGDNYITTNQPMYARACDQSTQLTNILNLTSHFYLAAENILELGGELARGLIADAGNHMFPFRKDQAASEPLPRLFVGSINLVAWGDCGGAFLHGPTSTCSWDGSAAPPTGDCEVRILWTLHMPPPPPPPPPPPSQPSPPTIECIPAQWPFALSLDDAAGPEFLVQCLPSGALLVPSIDVTISGFGADFITTNQPMYSRGCNKSSHVESILNLTSSFTLSSRNQLGVAGTLARGLVADTAQNMFPFRNANDTGPLGVEFVEHIILAGWGDCGGAYLYGPTGNCTWDGTTAPPQGNCEVEISVYVDGSSPSPTPSPGPAPSPKACPPAPWPFALEMSKAATPEFVVECLPSGELRIVSIDVVVADFGIDFITTNQPMYAKACESKTKVVYILNLTNAYTLASDNILELGGELARGLVADAITLFPFRNSSSAGVLGSEFEGQVVLAGWGDCGGAYLKGPSATACTWQGTDTPPEGECKVRINWHLPDSGVTPP